MRESTCEGFGLNELNRRVMSARKKRIQKEGLKKVTHLRGA